MANGVKITPNMNSKGIFEVQPPFRLNGKRVYEVIAIREFPDLWREDVDIYSEYYEEFGLRVDIYERDKKIGAAIVTLQGEDGIIHVPDTFIVSYPDLGLANYKHAVLSVSLGPIHTSKNLAGLQKEIEGICSKFLGINAKVKIHTAPVKDAMTADEAKQLEKVREGLINIPATAELQHLEELRLKNAIVRQINEGLLTRYKP